MEELSVLLQAPPSMIANYVAISLAGVSVTYIMLSRVFATRHTPIPYFGYFTLKAIVDAMFRYSFAQAGASPQLEQINALWSSVLAVVSLLVVWLSFEGDLLSVAACSFLSDIVAAMCTLEAMAIGNLLLGGQADVIYLLGFGFRTLLVVAPILGTALVARKVFTSLLVRVCHVVERFRLVTGALAASAISYSVLSTQRAVIVGGSDIIFRLMAPYALALLAVMALLLVWNVRDMRRREKTVRAVRELAASYNERIGERLESVEEELSVLSGHETSLRLLGSGIDSGLAERVERLRAAYRRLSLGAYCNRPALDAVLSACARRLESQGVGHSFTVAGVPESSVAPATTAFVLLELASEAAERAKVRRGEAVELRVRGVGEQVLLRLEVPARWGRLWARRLLTALHEQEAGLLRERVEGDRTVLLVVRNGAPS